MGISGTTAKSRKHKFVPSSHPGPFAVVASSQKSQTTILHTFLFALACTACTDMVYWKELECKVTTTVMVKAILHLKTWVFIPS